LIIVLSLLLHGQILNFQLSQKYLNSNEIKVTELEAKLKTQEERLQAEKDANEKLQALLVQQKSSINKVTTFVMQVLAFFHPKEK
jgi:LPS O-antigen subunit length determinant protein (WzzB/FepE family)